MVDPIQNMSEDQLRDSLHRALGEIQRLVDEVQRLEGEVQRLEGEVLILAIGNDLSAELSPLLDMQDLIMVESEN